MQGLYIHFPHCIRKCPYCDFYSICEKADDEKLLKGYIRDLQIYKDVENKKLTSIFIGGGTPSLMSENLLLNLFKEIKKVFTIDKNAEISIEVNPKTINFDKLKFLKNLGINRISIGCQSMNDENLNFLGRINNTKDNIQIINETKSLFDNISCDFMYALPNQKIDNWQKEIEEIAKLNLPHLSIYQLTIEKSTPFGKIYAPGITNKNDEKLYNLTNRILKYNGYKKYETSNYCKKGFECKHNLIYWQGDNYFAIGPSAHARFQKNGIWYKLENPADINKWEEKQTTPKRISNIDRTTEIILMHLRINKPFKQDLLVKKTGLKFENIFDLKELEKNNIKIRNNSIKLTASQQKILNYLLPRILK